MIFRKLEENDYEKYLPLIKDFRDTDFTEDEFRNNLNIIKKYSDIWVIEIDSQLICTGTIIYESKYIYNMCKAGHIEDICTKLEYRGKGYGKEMIHFLINEAKKNKCYKVNLVCSKENSLFYKKCGMEERGVHMAYLISKS